jgi:hypothetical protein
VSFDLATANAASGEPELVVVVQDETAQVEGAGERVVRYAVSGDHVDAADLLDGGVGHAFAELLPLGPAVLGGGEKGRDAAAPRWFAFTDTQEHAHVVPLGPSLRLTGAPTAEPSLDLARLIAAGRGDAVYAVGAAGGADAAAGRAELRRLICR